MNFNQENILVTALRVVLFPLYASAWLIGFVAGTICQAVINGFTEAA